MIPKLVIVNYKIKLNLLKGKQRTVFYSFIKSWGGRSEVCISSERDSHVEGDYG